MAERLKDMFFKDETVREFSKTVKKHYPRFDEKKFYTTVFDDTFKDLELMQMSRHTTECLARLLPKSYKQAVKILVKAIPELKGFEAFCVPTYVELHGTDDWDASLPAMAKITQYSSCEFAIRPFIKQDPSRALAFMLDLASDEHENVRRFASEGCRPRLPWAVALPAFKKDPSPILPILEQLKDDDSEFVRKSVANNLNDISKDHPELVLDICERWQGSSKSADWIIKRACRTMLKEGNRRAMLLFGFGDPKDLRIEKLTLGKKTVKISEKVQFSFQLNVSKKKKCKVRLEYIVYFAKAAGKTTKKVFQLSEKTYAPGTHTVKKNHAFVDMSTRKHYPGKHRISIVVNGVEKADAELTLKAK
jgi:3-methyladenine DNA glycosylase AlkC